MGALRLGLLGLAALAGQALAQPARLAPDLFRGLEKSPYVLVSVELPFSALSTLREGVADYTDAAAVTAYVERSAELFAAAKAKLLLEKQGLKLVRDYRYLPVLLAEVIDQGPAIAYLRSAAEVRSVTPDTPHAAFTAESLPLIGQPKIENYGATGKNVAVAVLDSGIDVNTFGCAAPGPDCAVIVARRMAPGTSSPQHGTHVAAIIRATAPEARLIDLTVFRSAFVLPSDVVGGIDWVVANRARHNIVAMNLSLGGGKFAAACGRRAYADAIEHALTAGVVSVAAAGNDAWPDGISEPACAPAAISVGAVYDADGAYPRCKDGKRGSIACFTNRAKFLGLLAPGADIKAGGVELGGTSQAAPFVAGAVAALWSFFRRAKPQEIRQIVLDSGATVKDPKSQLDFRRLDVESAFHLAKQRNLPQQ